MEYFRIEYIFGMGDDLNENFLLKIDAERLELLPDGQMEKPEWATLEFHQCPNCPLSKDIHPYCPVMANLANIVTRMGKVASYDEVYLEVITNERCISHFTTAQRGLSSLMGLVIATSGCPHTVFFKPMARFHLPLASEDETIYRAVSSYLVAQYFMARTGAAPDFAMDGLNRIYSNMQIINDAIAKRLRAASTTDSSVNAIIMLDLYAKSIPFIIRDSLEKIRPMFTPYLTADIK